MTQSHHLITIIICGGACGVGRGSYVSVVVFATDVWWKCVKWHDSRAMW